MTKPEHWTLAKFLKGEASASETEEVMSWVDASDENKKEFDQVKLIWDSYEEMGATFEPNLSAAWDKVESDLEPPSKFQISPWFYRVAAVLVLGFGVSYFIPRQPDPIQEQITVAEAVELMTQEDVKDFELPDGTVVTLNEGASIAYEENFGLKDRSVKLQGEAFFDVVRDVDRPFIIKTATTTTEVLGTSFSVNPVGENAIVTVVSGTVSFKGTDEAENVILTKGEQGNYEHTSKTISESVNEDLNFLSWKTGKLSFDDAEISRVVLDLERHYDVSIILENHNISGLSASFERQQLDEVLSIISATLDIQIDNPTNGSYIIR